MDLLLHPSLTSLLNGGERSESRPGRFNHREISCCTLRAEGFVDTRKSLDALQKRKISCLYWESNYYSSVTHLSLCILRTCLCTHRNKRKLTPRVARLLVTPNTSLVPFSLAFPVFPGNISILRFQYDGPGGRAV